MEYMTAHVLMDTSRAFMVAQAGSKESPKTSVGSWRKTLWFILFFLPVTLC